MLNLSGRELTAIPPEVFTVTGVRRLDLSRNRLTTLPPEIAHLDNLVELDLSDNRLMFLPAGLGRLSRLRSLHLGRNQLMSLPAEVGDLLRLETLDLWGCLLENIPDAIGNLAGLRHLNVGDNRLTDLPPGLARLTGLGTLELAGNRLARLPTVLTAMPALVSLDLTGNRLTELPPEIGGLVDLSALRLGGNRLTGLPSEIGRLTGLRTLCLGNGVVESPSPGVTRLAGTDPGGNRLTELPAEIGDLTELHTLDVTGNRLTELPASLAPLFNRGLSIHADGNPLPAPYPELLARGSTALAAYLSSLDDAVTLYEAKLLLVGEGNVGKSSLVAALRKEAFVSGRPSTHGIEIQPLTLQHSDRDTAMTVHAWDFGGQEVYRITHQFFFSSRAVYLMVWKPREGQEQNEVEGWLRRIRLRVAEDARVLIVATHCEERYPELNFTQLRREFPDLVAGQYEVDNASGRGIEVLRTAIAAEAARLPQMGQRLSRRWIAVRDDLTVLATRRPQIRYREFVDLCTRHRVTGDEVTALLNLLHDLGQVIYYGDDEGLRDIVVLNPEWMTKAMSYVLEDRPTRACGGVLDHARLLSIWWQREDGECYPPEHHPYFLRLMEKFDVSYRFGDDGQQSLVAQLVPDEEPDLPWDLDTPVATGMRAITLICRLSEPAPGLVAWLTVRHQHASTHRHWTSGVFLRHPIDAYGSEALLRSRLDGQLVLQVRAPSPDMFFHVLRDSVEHLIRTRWPGLTYRLYVPCPTRHPDGRRCEGQFPLEGLLRFRETGAASYPCLECQETHDVTALVTGFGAPVPPALHAPALHAAALNAAALHSDLDVLLAELRAEVRGSAGVILGEVRRGQEHAADAADAVRRVLKAMDGEVDDCPRLFTLGRERATGLRRLLRLRHHLRLTLWCEHPGHWHPCPAAEYHLRPPRQWVATIAPYALLVLSTLRLTITPFDWRPGELGGAVPDPIVGGALDQVRRMRDFMAAMPARLIDDPPAGGNAAGWSDLPSDGRPGAPGLSPAQGQALRAVRALLFQTDTARAFGDLRRVSAPSGEFLWVCPEHHREYDPGLPVLPRPVGAPAPAVLAVPPVPPAPLVPGRQRSRWEPDERVHTGRGRHRRP